MISIAQMQTLQANSAIVVGAGGDKIGKLAELYLGDDTDEPSWMTVKTGLFGTSETFVPLHEATVRGEDTIEVPYPKEFIKDAPRTEVDAHLSVDEEHGLFRYYEVDYPGSSDSDSDEASVVRSEEDVHVGTERREAGKVRLRKYVVTEHVTKTVPVQREEVRVEREPIAGDSHGAEIGDDAAEVTLHEEEVVVDKETKPVERVSLGTDTVTEKRTVEEKVRKEQVDVDGDEPGRRGV